MNKKVTSYEVGNLTLNTLSWEVYKGEKEIELSYMEFNILQILMKNENIVISRDYILDKLDKYTPQDSNLVDVYISYLRGKIDNDEEKNDKLIHTVRNVGYKIQCKK